MYNDEMNTNVNSEVDTQVRKLEEAVAWASKNYSEIKKEFWELRNEVEAIRCELLTLKESSPELNETLEKVDIVSKKLAENFKRTLPYM